MRLKTRLTISLPEELVRQLDQMIDKVNVRNRSHAIELILRDNLSTRVTKAVILAGGKKKHQQLPALLPIEDQKLILRTIRLLVQYGITTIYILAGENEEPLRAVTGEGRVSGAVLIYVPEPKPLGTAGALKKIEDQFDAEPFLVINGDILTDIDLEDFINFHKTEGTLATIAVKPRDAEKKYGKVILQGNKITQFSEPDQSEGISLVNTGIYLLQPEVFQMIGNGRPVSLESEVFPTLANLHEISAFFFQGIWFDISTPESYQLAQTRWANSY